MTTQVTKRNICFGVGNEMFSLVIFSAKSYIYGCRSEASRPKIQGFKICLKSIKNIELALSKEKNLINVFNNKWEPILQFLT
jgi:hypothetical protein